MIMTWGFVPFTCRGTGTGAPQKNSPSWFVQLVETALVLRCWLKFISLLLASWLVFWGLGVRLAGAAVEELTRLDIQELMDIPVYGASRYEQRLTEAPSYVTVVNRDDIKKYGYRTLADIIRSAPGFYISYDRNYHYVGVRGFSRPGDYSSRILLLLDGHRTNDNVYGSAQIGTDFPLEVDLIERVEIIRGPGSSLYGANAFFAVVNVITRRGRDYKGVEVSGEGGSFYTFKGRMSYGNQFSRGPEVLVSGSYYDSRGPSLYFPEYAATGNRGLARNDYDNYYNFFSKFSHWDFTLTGVWHAREKGIPTGAWGTLFNNFANNTSDTRAFLDLKYERQLANQWGIMARLYYDRYWYDGDFLYPGGIKNIDSARGSWWGGEAQVTKSFLDKYKFVIGMEYRDNLQQDQGNFNEKPREIFLDDKRVSAIWALYGQGDLALFSKLRLVVGLRYDSYSNFGGSLSPRGGLIFTPFKSTTLKLLYGKAFRAPNAYELYYQDGNVTTKANADLRPETIQTYEAVWEQFLGRHWFLTTSGYYYRIRDLIGQRTDPADGLIVFNNLDRIEAGGVETALSGKWPGGLETRLSYSFQKAVNSKTGQILSNCPKHLGKVNLNIPLLKDKVFAGVEVHYLAKRLTLDRSQVGDAVIANLTLFSKNLIKNLEVSASVYNLLNQRYRDPGAEEHLMVGLSTLRQDGISFRLKLNYLY